MPQCGAQCAAKQNLTPEAPAKLTHFVFAVISISLDFANEDQWTAADDKLRPSCVAGVRVLANHLFGVPVSDLRADSTWSRNAHLEAECSMARVMRFIAERERHEAGLSPDAWIVVLLACDGYQCIREVAGIGKASMVTNALASWMINGKTSADLHSFPPLQDTGCHVGHLTVHCSNAFVGAS